MSNYTQLQKAWVKEHCNLSLKQLANEFNIIFNLDKSAQSLKALRLRNGWLTGRTGHYATGNIPLNKGTKGLTGANSGSFKKGCTPVNHRAVGSERINVHGYIEIKVSEPRFWELKNRVLWQDEYGDIPENYAVRFIDNNRLNCVLDNLELVSQAVNLRLNKMDYVGYPVDLKPAVKSIAELEVKTFERKNSL